MYHNGVNYLLQTDNFRCGTIVSINALKFLELDFSSRDIFILDRLLNCSDIIYKRNGSKVVSGKGVWPWDLYNGLKLLSKTTKQFEISKVQPKLEVIEKGFNKGHCFILNHFTRFINLCSSSGNPYAMSHYVLLVPSGKNNVKVINHNIKVSKDTVTKEELRKKYLDIKLPKDSYNLLHPLPNLWKLKRTETE